MLTATTMLSSCSDDDDLLPEVLESEVYNEGETGEITVKTGTDGTTLSYESWIMVRGTTRASFDNRVSVTLNGTLNDVDSACTVDNWRLENCETSVSYENAGTRTDGFVTITDSVLVYTVKYDEFSFSFRLDYEVPVYDDGVSRQVMPYHRYTNLKDLGYTLKTADSYVDGEIAYARQIYQHKISVDFGGKSYTVTADITLRRWLGYAEQPYIVRSSLIAEGIWAASEHILTSVLNIHQIWSDGSTVDDPVVCYFSYEDESRMLDPASVTARNFKNDLAVSNAWLSGGEKAASLREGPYLEVYTESYFWNVNYGYFQIAIPLELWGAFYDDGVLSRELPKYGFDDITTEAPELVFENSGSDANGRYNVYQLKQKITVKMGEITFTRTGFVYVTAYEE